MIIYSDRGGMTLPRIEACYPETVHKIYVEHRLGLDLKQLLRVAIDLGMENQQSSLVFLIKNLYECFLQRDALRVSINPLVLTRENEIKAANCHVYIDPDASYRQQEMQSIQDFKQATKLEKIAIRSDMKFVDLHGNIGIISNGAAVGMATSDYVAECGGKPANFLDAGGFTVHE